jgi:DNA replicative helicase MCM subunit Mcm2 (Cdc46/Mcm family)
MVQNHEKMIHDLEKHHEEDMKKNYENQSKYRQQSLNKQASIDVKFDDVNNKIDELKELILNHYEETKVLKRNELREKLLTNYRYYTSLEQNPSQSWNEMEADAFWHLFKDYEKLNGNGFMHTTVKPAMEKLDVTTIH